MSTPVQPLTLLVVAIASWLQRDQQAAIVLCLSPTLNGGSTVYFKRAEFWHRTGWRMVQAGAIRSL